MTPSQTQSESASHISSDVIIKSINTIDKPRHRPRPTYLPSRQTRKLRSIGPDCATRKTSSEKDSFGDSCLDGDKVEIQQSSLNRSQSRNDYIRR